MTKIVLWDSITHYKLNNSQNIYSKYKNIKYQLKIK